MALKNIIESLQTWNFIEIEKRGTSNIVSLSEDGKNALKFLNPSLFLPFSKIIHLFNLITEYSLMKIYFFTKAGTKFTNALCTKMCKRCLSIVSYLQHAYKSK